MVRHFSLLLLPMLLAGGTAMAQKSESVDDIVNSLRPTSSQLRGPTRGIRPVVTTPDGTRAPVRRTGYVGRAAAPAAVTDGGALPSASLTVNFMTGSAELTPAAEQTLDRLGKALTSADLAASHFRIEGHTDTVGEADANKDLSARRAQAVLAYLEQRFTIPAARLDAVGVGTDDLLVPTPPQTPEPRNRRVKVVNVSG